MTRHEAVSLAVDHGGEGAGPRPATTGAREADRPAAPASGGAPRTTVCSDELFRGGHEIVIVHGRDEYRLRITRAGKLILTK